LTEQEFTAATAKVLCPNHNVEIKPLKVEKKGKRYEIMSLQE
jgi:hypothetical protein